MILVLLVFIVGCKEGGGSSSSQNKTPSPSESPAPIIDEPGEAKDEAGNPAPSPTPFDHSARSPQYGTVPTATECAYMAKWKPGLDEVWLFSPYSSHDLQLKHYLRFTKLGVTEMSPLLPSGMKSRHLNDEGFILGDCYIHIKNSDDGIDYVMWKNVLITP